MACDEDQDGVITRQDLITQIYDRKLVFPHHVLNFFLNTLASDQSENKDSYLEKLECMLKFDGSLSKELNFSQLQSILQIYYRCPMYTQENTNSSYNFKKIICMQGYEDVDSGDESTKVQ